MSTIFEVGQEIRVIPVRGDTETPSGGRTGKVHFVGNGRLHASVDFGQHGLVMLTFSLDDLRSLPADEGPPFPDGQWAIRRDQATPDQQATDPAVDRYQTTTHDITDWIVRLGHQQHEPDNRELTLEMLRSEAEGMADAGELTGWAAFVRAAVDTYAAQQRGQLDPGPEATGP